MRTRPFGATGTAVAVVGQGTWEIERDRAASVRALRRGLDLGMTHIDTAEMYGSGACEEIVAEAIEGRRRDVFIVSKVLPQNASFDGTLEACGRSLKRLRTDHLDVYLLHWRAATPLAETFRAFDRLMREGKILQFGVSNFDVADLEEAWTLDTRIACNQVLYHVKERAIEHAVIPWCEKHNVAVVAYSPFGEGDFPADDPGLKRVAAATNATVRQVALAFLTRRPSTFTIPKASRIEHVEENAGEVQLTEEHVAWIDQSLPKGPTKPLPMI